ncbi:ADP-ribosylglycohydrolase family protein [Nakamurella aerolata]|uniref:ADP-ribosylglycohydrolase family protein n=1 Tax=Nakamurella aerolata TaxID=1656892 RepID=A0A849A515_9ACTN|nr:ADP-ribosylglycohydrolase family protein [Nakamurella aerolata]NNG34218.1 ADP-ribosylglycohydrolase family protein [Nakamurella aerolata]
MTSPANLLQDKAIGALSAAAVGDAIGGATEGRSHTEIVQRYDGPVTGIVDYFMKDWRTAKPMSPYHKGDGHVTDDTLMTNLLIKVYAKHRRHLTAFDMASDLVPLMMTDKTWIPELETETVPILRVFLAEKWLVTRLYYGHNDPREAGVGNVVNCGAAMYMAPVGIANAGDPAGAYAEAIEITGAHQSSYGREAAAVFAAAVAAAMAPGATVDDVLAAVTALAKDGTADAIAAVLASVEPGTDWQQAISPLREAIRPFDTVGEQYRTPAQDSRRPSRLKSIEELPVALGFLKATNGDVAGCILGATNYGRDSDSIATMGGAIAGALGGAAAVPAEWVDAVSTGSQLDLRAGGIAMAEIASEIHAADKAAFAARDNAFSALTAPPVAATSRPGGEPA